MTSESLSSGVEVALNVLQTEEFLSEAIIEYRYSKDQKGSCSFLFLLSSRGNNSVMAEVVLSKKEWRLIKKKIIEENASISW